MEIDINSEKCPYCGATNEWVKGNSCKQGGIHAPKKGKNEVDNETDNSKTGNLVVKRSFWYIFAEIMIILGGISVLIMLIVTLSERSWHRNWTPFLIVFCGYLIEVGFWAIVHLLADIKFSVDNLLQNMKK